MTRADLLAAVLFAAFALAWLTTNTRDRKWAGALCVLVASAWLAMHADTIARMVTRWLR